MSGYTDRKASELIDVIGNDYFKSVPPGELSIIKDKISFFLGGIYEDGFQDGEDDGDEQ